MDISVVIPCFNHGLYIQDAIDSVLKCKEVTFEIIIIDDGSTDELTLVKLYELKHQGYKVLRHDNQGPAFTRNVGIREAAGKYILPLDADNLVKTAYITKAITILNENHYDIVYSNPIFFGENLEDRRFKVQPFNGPDLFINNYIDTCAIYRKEVWTQLEGYDPNLPFHGNEDWEFWVHAFIKGFRFKHIDEQLFYYRVLENSLMSKSASNDIHSPNRTYIIKKHLSAFIEVMTSNYNYGKMYERDQNNPLRSSLKYFANSIGLTGKKF